MNTINSSTIVTEEEVKLLKNWINPNENINLELLYRASRDGDEVRTFHRLCDEKGPTLVVVKNSFNSRYGGYTSIPWSSVEGYQSDDTAFIFSLDAKKNIQLQTQMERFIIMRDMVQHLVVHMTFIYAIFVYIKVIVLVGQDMIIMLALKK